jgi:hypothetical protein
VSEHASWCINFYSRILEAALAATGAPPGLVSFVTGYGDAGHALVTGGVDKVWCVTQQSLDQECAGCCVGRLLSGWVSGCCGSIIAIRGFFAFVLFLVVLVLGFVFEWQKGA